MLLEKKEGLVRELENHLERAIKEGRYKDVMLITSALRALEGIPRFDYIGNINDPDKE